MAEPTTDVAVALAKPLALKLFDALLQPIVGAAQSVADPLVDVFGNRFAEYLTRQLVKHSYLPTIVFQVRQPLEDIYVALTVIEENSFSNPDERQHHKIEGYDKSFIPKRERVLVIDNAGMGKTTLSRFLFVQAIKTLATVPVFIELRHLSADKTILDHLIGELNPIGADPQAPKIDRRQITRLMEKGVFTFFLDGYDEVTSGDRERVTRDIKSIVETYPQNKFLITSRPEQALASFPSFQAFRIQPLKRDEAFELIRKYDKGGEKAERLITRLSDRSLIEVDEFLKNPLLTTLLYRAYDYKAQIPLKKPNFYRQVFDALFEWHDLTKDGYSTREKTCKLDIDGFHKVLRGLGFVSIMQGRVEADTDQMLDWIRTARTYAPELTFSESDFLEDAIRAVPILRREGNAVLWAHKSLAEYFCAQFIVTDAKVDQAKICEFLAQSINLPSFRNVLDLLYDMDIRLFGQHFIKPMIDFYQGELTRLATIFPNVPSGQVELRAATTFGRRLFVLQDTPGPLPRPSTKRIQGISASAMKEWYGLEAMHDSATIIDDRLTLDFNHFSRPSDRRILSLSHALRTVFAVLINKKHPLVLLKALYPTEFQKGEVLGVKASQGLPINETPGAVWNNAKNFSNTTNAIARGSAGILNVERIAFALREIELTSGKSQTTAALLSSLGLAR